MKIGSGKIFPILLIAIALLMPLEPAAQNNRGNGKKEETKDSLLTLLNAEYARVFQLPGGREYREVKGPAVFLHNGAYLFCDSAIWNLSYNRIEAYKNVKIVQDKTVITGDNLNYYADDNVAKFRGDLVEVSDEKHNMLRTRYLDYNTKDSVAVFFFGGAMQSEKGEIIEGDRGNYDAKTGLFNFKDNVEMFTDSLFMKSSKLDYDTNINKAFFGKNTHLWKNDYYMRANDGWYARDTGVVFFNDGVYMNDPDYESWCDSLYFYQHANKGDMFGNVQLLDSLNNTYFLSDKAHTETDSVGNLHAFLFDRAASINIGENQQHQIDTLFCRADTMYFHTERVCDIPSSIISESEEFETSIMFDAIAEADRKALEKKEADRQSAIEQLPEYKAYKKRLELAEKDSLEKALALQKAAEEAELAGGNAAAEPQNAAQEGAAEGAAVNPAANPEGGAAVAAEGSPESAEGAEAATNEAAAEGGAEGAEGQAEDATKKPEESETPPDTTQLRFVSAYGNVRIYRTDIQARCDSMAFSQIDTLMKLFKDPVVWNEGIHQLTGETMLFMMKDGAFDRGCMQGGAMIISMEDTVHFNQVKSTEMLGYFNSDNQLRRYDALGGVNALFYVREDSVITVMNSKEAQFMMVTLKNGAAQRLKYYETVKSDAYPVADLAIEKQRLKGFNWRDAERPKDRFEITDRKLRKSRRDLTKSTAMPTFPRANDYYAGYMTDIYKQIADRAEAARLEMLRRDSIEQVRQVEEAMAHIDSTMGIAGTVSKEGDVLIDSLATPPTPTATVAEKAVSPIDSLMAEERPKESKAKSKKVVIETPSSQEIAEVELVQTPSEDKKLTRSERKALRKAARQLKREQRKARRLMRKAPIPETQQ